MQNNLQELWSLFSFVQPGLLKELPWFEKEFCDVIMRGGFTNATALEVEMSQVCITRLKTMILSHILRRTKKQLRLECNLPERKENIVICPMSECQLSLYELYVGQCMRVFDNREIDDARSSG